MDDLSGLDLLVCLIEADPEHARRLMLDVAEIAPAARVEVVPEAEAALAWLRQGSAAPGLILVSSSMRGQPEPLLSRLRAEQRLALVPLAVVTWPGSTVDIAHAFRLGAAAYISPINERHDLRAVLRNTALYWAATRRATSPPRPARETVIVLVTPDPQQARRLARALDAAGLAAPIVIPGGEELVRWLAGNDCDACVVDDGVTDLDALETVVAVRQRRPDLPVILLSGAGTEQAAIAAFHTGVFDYIPRRGDYAASVAQVARQAVEAGRGGAGIASPLRSPGVPEELLRPTYQNRLRVIGHQLDLFGHGSVRVVEVHDGFLVRGTIPGGLTPEALSFPDRFFPQLVASAMRRRGGTGSRRSPSPLLATGYEDFLRAVGHRLDEHRAEAITITELAGFMSVGGVRDEGTAGRAAMAPFQWLLGPQEIAALLEEARGRRGR